MAYGFQRKDGQAWRDIRWEHPLANSRGEWQGKEPSGLRQTLRLQTSSDAIAQDPCPWTLLDISGIEG